MNEDDALPEGDGTAQDRLDADLPPSRSAQKRDADYRKALGIKLTTLGADQLARLDLPERLTEALTEFARLRARGAKKRQLQFIGGLMRDLDPEPVQNLIDELEGQSASVRYVQHQCERWRDRLIAEPGALTEFIDAFPSVDRQQLRQRVDKARKAAPEPQHKRAMRELFRLLKDPIELAAAETDEP
ncbi:MAG: ribosome biogenesis factor YjgA [Pseudomonadales bacterium]